MLNLRFCAGLALYLAVIARGADSAVPSDWSAVDEETMRHFQALVRMDTSDPPGNEAPAAEYLKSILEAEGIETRIFALDPQRPNVVARLRGNGSKRPLLIMAHTDVVNVAPKKWKHPPFSATREGGYVYGRGTVDDKDNVTASLMTMLLLKRSQVPLDRDVIFLAEAGEEGNVRFGVEFMVREHRAEIDAEFCLAEGGTIVRTGGKIQYGSVQTTEKIPDLVRPTARGVAGHGSVPLRSNAVVHLSRAIAKIADWQTPMRLNETTRAYATTASSPSASVRSSTARTAPKATVPTAIRSEFSRKRSTASSGSTGTSYSTSPRQNPDGHPAWLRIHAATIY